MLNQEDYLLLKERRRRKLTSKMATIKFCPNCKSENVAIDGALIEVSAGAMVCKDCGYRDINFPEKVTTTKTKKSES